MKKIRLLFIFFIFAVIFQAILISWGRRALQFDFDDENNLLLSIKTGNDEVSIRPYFDEESGITYFFLPSFIKNQDVFCDKKIRVNGVLMRRWGGFKWDEGTIYQIAYDDCSLKIQFMQSQNLPAIFLDTESGNLDYLNMDKNNSETGYLRVVQNSGNLEYEGVLKKISERGQSTFIARKRSFSFILEDKYPLCGLDSGKKWNLLSLFYEQNKIQSKIVYDMAEYLNMEYATGSTWVDVYCNGQWTGLYLLTEAVTIGEGRVDIYDLETENEKVNKDTNFDLLELIRDEKIGYYDIASPLDISGGYLIEKENIERLSMLENSYFITNAGNYFTLKKPRQISKAEVEYVAQFVQKIEDLLQADNPEYKNHLDEESFAKQFLIDKIVLEIDAMSRSTYFYIDRDSGILKSGPLWDYDRAMGNGLSDYTLPVEGWPGEMNNWYSHLYHNEQFKEKMIQYYLMLLPYIETLLDSGIDEYAGWISASLEMEKQRWGYTGENVMTYLEYENYIRYLKYFLVNRLEYLNEEWEISYDLTQYIDSGTNDMHTVTFLQDDGSVLSVFGVKDGECINKLPHLDENSGKRWVFSHSNITLTDKIPIYEDVAFDIR